MAKKAASSSPLKKSAPAAPPKAAPAKIAAPVVATSSVRNSPVPKAAPKAAAAPRKEITHGDIARRAYEIYTSGTGGSEMDNWCRAERELRAGL